MVQNKKELSKSSKSNGCEFGSLSIGDGIDGGEGGV